MQTPQDYGKKIKIKTTSYVDKKFNFYRQPFCTVKYKIAIQ